jgi:hypothetical protein
MLSPCIHPTLSSHVISTWYHQAFITGCTLFDHLMLSSHAIHPMISPYVTFPDYIFIIFIIPENWSHILMSLAKSANCNVNNFAKYTFRILPFEENLANLFPRITVNYCEVLLVTLPCSNGHSRAAAEERCI